MLFYKVQKEFEPFETRFIAFGDQMLSYFELLPKNLEMQGYMDTFIESYRLSENEVYKKNLDYIRI